MSRFVATMLSAIAVALPATAHAAGPICEARWADAARGRALPVRIRMPDGVGRAPVILFSHGLGGSVEAGTDWGRAWADAGFIVIHLQHPGSDTDAVRGGGIRGAMNGQQLIARGGDVKFAIDQLGRAGRVGDCDLARVDAARIGMAGHSFGSHTTLAVAGQRFPGYGAALADTRIKSAIAFSPAPSRRAGDAESFGAIGIPVLSLTGTQDMVPMLNDTSANDRTRPFRAMPAGGKYLIVYDGANHAAFGGRGNATPRVTASIIAATTDFWRATLLGDAAARRRLDRFGSTLTPADRFERK